MARKSGDRFPASLLVPGILILSLATWFVLESGRSRESSPSAPRENSTPSFAPEETEVLLETDAVQREAQASKPTLAHTLEYWGTEWPAVRDRLSAEGIDPDLPFDLRPWSEAESKLRNFLVPNHEKLLQENLTLYKEWPDELTFTWLKEHFRVPESFTESDLYRVEEVAAPFNSRIDELADQASGIFEVILDEKWTRGGFTRAPYSTKLVPNPPSEEEQRQCFWGASAASGTGWTAAISVSRSECPPELLAMRTEMQTLQARRDVEISSLLRGRR